MPEKNCFFKSFFFRASLLVFFISVFCYFCHFLSLGNYFSATSAWLSHKLSGEKDSDIQRISKRCIVIYYLFLLFSSTVCGEYHIDELSSFRPSQVILGFLSSIHFCFLCFSCFFFILFVFFFKREGGPLYPELNYILFRIAMSS